MPTDAYGDVQFGSIDVASGNLTHVRGEQGGMWLAVHKEATRLPVTTAMAYLAYSDEASAQSSWEILGIACAQGPATPDGAVGFPGAPAPEVAALSRCHWLRALNSSGGLEAPMRFELSASGLAEDRDEQAYAAALTYTLVYGAAEGGTPNPNEGTPSPARREQFTVDIYTRVSAVAVAPTLTLTLTPNPNPNPNPYL